MTDTVYLLGGHNGRQVSMSWGDWLCAVRVGFPISLINAACDKDNYPIGLKPDQVQQFATQLRECLAALPQEAAFGEFVGPVIDNQETAAGRYSNYFLTSKASWLELSDFDMFFFDCFPDCADIFSGAGHGKELFEDIIDLFSNGSHVNVYLEDVQRKAIVEHLKAYGFPDKPVLFGSFSKETKQEGIWLMQSIFRNPDGDLEDREKWSRSAIMENIWDRDMREAVIIGMQTDLNLALKEAERIEREGMTGPTRITI